jgi:hypothetical protein
VLWDEFFPNTHSPLHSVKDGKDGELPVCVWVRESECDSKASKHFLLQPYIKIIILRAEREGEEKKLNWQFFISASRNPRVLANQ